MAVEQAALTVALPGWADYEAMAATIDARFDGQFSTGHYDYVFPRRLQAGWPLRQRADTPVRLAYTAWGPAAAPMVLCLGGVANTARRFDYLASALAAEYRVLCLDWPGRGGSGWLPRLGDYRHATYLDLVQRFVTEVAGGPVRIVGSSLGATVGLVLAGRRKRLVDRLVLNDTGPFIPASRRRRRAQALARHYVFRSPAELFRRAGAANKNEGPVPDEVLLHNTYHQTRWSDEDGGRVYRLDDRALDAYAAEATGSLALWPDWRRVACPCLVLHGQRSDALSEATIARMRRGKELAVVQIPGTGHTPALSDPNQVACIRDWLGGRGPDGDWHCFHAETAPRRLFHMSTV